MIKETIEYIDFDGNEQKEEYYFHMTQLELIDMADNLGVSDIESYLNQLIVEKNTIKMLKFFKELMLRSFGIKATDGKRFIKDKAATEEFGQSLGFAELFEEIMTDEGKAKKFAESVVGSHKKIKPVLPAA